MLKVGDTVQFRFYNTPEHKFYGDVLSGKIVEIQGGAFKLYYVKYEYAPGKFYTHALLRKEIKRRVK